MVCISLVDPIALVIRKEEGLVLHNGAAQRPAKHVLLVRSFGLVRRFKESARIESFVSQEFEGISVETIRPGLCCGVHHASGAPAEFRRVVGRLNLELRDSVRTAQERDVAVIVRVVLDAVKDKIILVAAGPVDGKTAARVPVCRRAAAVHGALDDLGHARSQGRKIRVSASIQGQLFHLLAGNNAAQRSIRRLHQRGCAADFHRLCHRADLQAEIHAHTCLDVEHNVLAHHFLKALSINRHRIRPDLQGGDHVVAIRAALHGCRDPGINFRRGYRSAGDHRSACVRYGSNDGRGINLGKPSHSRTDNQKYPNRNHF